MQELFPDYLKGYIRADKIDISYFETPGIARVLPNGFIFLNIQDALEEQVVACLHEITHFHPVFMSYTGGLWEGTIVASEDVESMIEQHAIKVYEQRPDIVDLVKAAIKDSMPQSIR